MNVFKLFALMMLFSTGIALAQDKGAMGDFDMKVADSNFPTPPNADFATAVVNYQLDYIGLKAGRNLLHTDRVSGIKLFANYNNYTRKFNLIAKDDQNEEVPVVVNRSKDDPNCIFATVLNDWVNVIVSTRYTYSEDIKSKNSNKK